jgi:hypothetical protein
MNKVSDKKGKKVHHLLGHLNNMTIKKMMIKVMHGKMMNKTMNKKMMNKVTSKKMMNKTTNKKMMSKVICKKKTQQKKKATIATLAIAIV